MYKKAFTALNIFNIVLQGLFSLVFPIGLGVLFSWLGVTKWGAPGWLYAILIPVGALVGLMSMVKFILSATRGLERIEAEGREREKQRQRDKADWESKG